MAETPSPRSSEQPFNGLPCCLFVLPPPCPSAVICLKHAPSQLESICCPQLPRESSLNELRGGRHLLFKIRPTTCPLLSFGWKTGTLRGQAASLSGSPLSSHPAAHSLSCQLRASCEFLKARSTVIPEEGSPLTAKVNCGKGIKTRIRLVHAT